MFSSNNIIIITIFQDLDQNLTVFDSSLAFNLVIPPPPYNHPSVVTRVNESRRQTECEFAWLDRCHAAWISVIVYPRTCEEILRWNGCGLPSFFRYMRVTFGASRHENCAARNCFVSSCFRKLITVRASGSYSFIFVKYTPRKVGQFLLPYTEYGLRIYSNSTPKRQISDQKWRFYSSLLLCVFLTSKQLTSACCSRFFSFWHSLSFVDRKVWCNRKMNQLACKF